MRDLAVGQAKLVATMETVVSQNKSIFRTLNGSGEAKGLVTKIAMIEEKQTQNANDIGAILDKLNSIQESRSAVAVEDTKGKWGFWIAVVTAIGFIASTVWG